MESKDQKKSELDQAQQNEKTLHDFLRLVDESNVHGEIDFGWPVGKEIPDYAAE